MGMPMRMRIVAALMLAGCILVAARAEAGTFMRFQGTDTLSVQPLRYRIRFAVLPTHLFGVSLCGLDVVPGTFEGSPPRPVLAADGPPGATWSIDSAGSAHLDVTPCRPNRGSGGAIDSLAIVVDGLPAYFNCMYLGTGGVPQLGDFMYVPSVDLTPTRRATWGSLKVRFR